MNKKNSTVILRKKIKYPCYFVNTVYPSDNYVCHVIFKPKDIIYVYYYDKRRIFSFWSTIEELKDKFTEISAQELALMKGSVPIDKF